jgi:hypothetical protein
MFEKARYVVPPLAKYVGGGFSMAATGGTYLYLLLNEVMWNQNTLNLPEPFNTVFYLTSAIGWAILLSLSVEFTKNSLEEVINAGKSASIDDKL